MLFLDISVEAKEEHSDPDKSLTIAPTQGMRERLDLGSSDDKI